MKKIVTILGVLIAIVVIGLLIIGMLLPDDYYLERSTVINAPSEMVFPHVNNLSKNEAWSPWSQDETLKTTYGEIVEGLGATSSWTSENSGSGSMRISESTPYTSITTDLDFGEMGTAIAKWHFEAVQEGTKATWNISGKAPNLIGKFFVAMIESSLGPQYEKGLANLKALVEIDLKEKS